MRLIAAPAGKRLIFCLYQPNTMFPTRFAGRQEFLTDGMSISSAKIHFYCPRTPLKQSRYFSVVGYVYVQCGGNFRQSRHCHNIAGKGDDKA